MLLHFDDATSLTGARLWRRDKLVILYGLHHTLELQCVGGPDNDPIDMEALGCTRWELKITPSLASPSLILASATYEENIAVGDTLSFDFSTATVEMYRYVAGERTAPGVLQLLGYMGSESTPTVGIQFPLILRTTAVNPVPPDLSTALMNEIQRAADSTTSAAEATSSNASIVDSLTSAVEAMSTQTQSNTDYVSSAVASIIVDSGSMAEMLSSATAAASSAQSNADHTDSNVQSSEDLLSSTASTVDSGISRMESGIAVADSIYSNTSSVASVGMDITSSNVQSSMQLLSATSDAMDSTLAASATTASNTASVAQMSTAVRSDTQSTAQMRTDVQGMSSNVVSMSNAVSNMDTDVTSMSTAVSAMSSNVDTMSASIYNMESNVETMSSRVQILEQSTASNTDLASSYASAASSSMDAAAASESSADSAMSFADLRASNADNAASEGESAMSLAQSAATSAAADTASAITAQFIGALSSVDSSVSAASAAASDAASAAVGIGSMVDAAYHYMSDAQVWAEGVDSDVSSLGGEHSAKGWAQNASIVVSDIAESAASQAASAVASQVASDAQLADSAASNANTWAEGTDEEVQALGGEHSAKGWAQEASHGGQWGSIGGDIEDQTDLMDKFDSKANLVDGTVPVGELPLAGTTASSAGAVFVQLAFGLQPPSGSAPLRTAFATNPTIDARNNFYMPITPGNLNYAVTAALTDQNHITLSTEQQATAQEVLGVPAPIIGDTAPTTATVGKLMQPYLNSTTGKTYHCTAITNMGTEAEPVWEYTWTDDINEKGGTFGQRIIAPDITVSSSMFGLGATEARYPRCLALGNKSAALWFDQFVIGSNLSVGGIQRGNGLLLLGKNNALLAVGDDTFARITGGGTSSSNRKNIEELSWTGDLYIAGGHQQGITVIPAATTAYTLAEGVQSHTPAEASTYVFPAVTDTTRTHRIRLILDFTTVQTYAFEDSQGNALAPLFTPTISAGDVYEFDCEYSVAKSTWLIWPHKQGAVSDDYVMQSEVGAANGVAGLDANGLVPRGSLPKAGMYGGAGVGVVTWLSAYGIEIDSNNGIMKTIKATNAQINARGSNYTVIVPANLNYAVTAALTDANKIQLTDAQKASAQDTIGAYGTLHLDAAPTTSTVGAFGQRAIVDSTGKCYTCTAVNVDETDPENPVMTYTWQEDLPVASGVYSQTEGYRKGIVRVASNRNVAGISMDSNGAFSVYSATINAIDERPANYNTPIVPKNLEYAVRSVLPNITEIPAATSAYTLTAQDATTNNHCMTYEHAPESAPTYTLPAVSGNAVKREIILTVRFSSTVLTYAFEDAAGNPLTPLPLAGTIVDGSVVCFRCTWEALLNQWVIMPVMLGTYVAPQSGPHLACVSQNSAYAGNYYVESGTGTSTVFFSRALNKYIWCDGTNWLLDSDMSSATATRLTLNAAEGSPMFSDPTGWSDMQDTTGTVSLTYVEA